MQRDARPTVAVVGGGISGLVAAWRLRHAAHVVLLEQAPIVGGKLRLAAIGELVVDVGAESVLARRPEAVELIAELGLATDLTHPASTAANVVRGGRLHPLPARTVLGVPSDAVGVRGLLTDREADRVAAEADLPPLSARDPDVDPAGDPDVDVSSWVGGRLGSAVVERLVEPLLGGVYAGQARLLSARATLPALWTAAHRSGSLLAGAAQLAGPAQFGVAAATGRPVFAGIVGGVGRLPARLGAQLTAAGVEVRTGVTVRALDRGPGRISGWRLTTGAVPWPQSLEVDAVVLAVPAAAAARLLAGVSPHAAAELAGVEAASVAVVACLLPRQALAGVPGSGVLVPPVEGRPVKAMTFSSAKWAWVDDLSDQLVVVRLSLGRHREEVVLQRDDEELAALAVADAEDLLRRPLRPVASEVTRWGGALPQYAVGHLDRVARIRAEIARLPGLAVCGAVLDGVGVPACIAAADAAAAQVLSQLPTSSS